MGARALHGVLWEGSRVELLHARRADFDADSGTEWVRHAVEDWVGRHRPGLVAVDAPCAGAADPAGKRGRLCEALTVEHVDRCWREANPASAPGILARFGIAPSPSAFGGGVPEWMQVGYAIYAALGQVGYPLAEGRVHVTVPRPVAMEVYPDATFWLLAIERTGWSGHRAPLQRKRHASVTVVAPERLGLLPRAMSQALRDHPDFPGSASGRINFIDAAAAALTGALAMRGHAIPIEGRRGEGVIWLPRASGADGAATTGAPTQTHAVAASRDEAVGHGAPAVSSTGAVRVLDRRVTMAERTSASGCVLCSICAGRTPASTVWSGEQTIAIASLDQPNPFKVLVFPRRHVETIYDLDDDMAADVFRTAVHVARAVRAASACPGLNVVQSNGRAGQQDVFHFHLHLLPRFPNDCIVMNWDQSVADRAVLDRYAEQLRRSLGG